MNKTSLKILSWNIWEQCRFDLAKDFLMKNNADIIGLQEVLLDDPSRDVVGFLKDLGYQPVLALGAEFSDKDRVIKMHNAIFSKFPILESVAHTLVENRMGSCVEARIDTHAGILNFFSTHLKHTHQKPSDFQNTQTDNLIKLLPKTRTVVMGDFNSVPGSYPVTKMEENFKNTDLTSKPTWGLYKEGCPVCQPTKLETRLDYIFVSPDVGFESFHIEKCEASDHLPISVAVKV